ncbi:ABC transporter permease [Paenibacillus aurantiacus]|uniref:ABC transporter permease n=1 Tax=Paenibacillus aurantiacus TaxID=1936118 RepID=A0ABV5KM34_9BACL
MSKLMAIEWRKHRLSGYARATVWVTLLLAVSGLLLPLLVQADSGSVDALFTDYGGAFGYINLMTGTAFMVLASVLASKLVVGEYVNPTIQVLVTYPVSRTRSMLAKLAVIAGWTFASVLIAGLLASGVFWAGNLVWHFIDLPLTLAETADQALTLVLLAASSAGLGLLSIPVGLRTKSVPATILSTLLIAAALNLVTSVGGASSLLLYVSLALGGAGFLLAFLAAIRLERQNVSNL